MVENCRWPSGPDTEPKQFDRRVEVGGSEMLRSGPRAARPREIECLRSGRFVQQTGARQITPIAPERHQAQ